MELQEILIALVVGVVVFLWLGTALTKVTRRLSFGKEREAILKAWAEVDVLVKRGDELSLRLAVIHGDGVLDMGLRAKAFPGKTMADRLRFATHKYRGLKQVGWAHGLRNTLVHEPGYQFDRKNAKAAVIAFRAALHELGAL